MVLSQKCRGFGVLTRCCQPWLEASPRAGGGSIQNHSGLYRVSRGQGRRLREQRETLRSTPGLVSSPSFRHSSGSLWPFFPLSHPTAGAAARHSLLGAVGHLEHGLVPGGAVHWKVPHPPTGCQGAGGHIRPAHGRWGRRRASQHLTAAETPRTPHQWYGLSLALPVWMGSDQRGECHAEGWQLPPLWPFLAPPVPWVVLTAVSNPQMVLRLLGPCWKQRPRPVPSGTAAPVATSWWDLDANPSAKPVVGLDFPTFYHRNVQAHKTRGLPRECPYAHHLATALSLLLCLGQAFQGDPKLKGTRFRISFGGLLDTPAAQHGRGQEAGGHWAPRQFLIPRAAACEVEG